MADSKNQQRETDSPPHADPKGVNPTGTGLAQPRETEKEQPGAEHAGATADADQDTYD